ncbi:MAG: hypothetical protein WB676_18905 [Bryobacteraceae bacterium]
MQETELLRSAIPGSAPVLRGTLRALFLFDIAEEIDLQQLHSILGTSPSKREPSFVHITPEYVRYERPPVLDHISPCTTSAGQVLSGRVRYFDYGVASIELQLGIAGGWQELIRVANRWFESAELEERAQEALRAHLERTRVTLKKAYEGWTSEEYYIVQLDPILSPNGLVTSEELLRECGGYLAQLVRGEESPLAMSERQEVLQASMSYYTTDLLVVGWTAAVVYDTPAGARATVDLLEYANTQLLEFRYYDEVLTRVLESVYKTLDRRRRFFSRWDLVSKARQLNSIRIEIRELSERTDNAIKFLSDMFYARAYRLAAIRIGVEDYHSLVNEKLSTAGELYDSMVNEFHQGRAFILELLVVIILIIELVFLFRGGK